MSPASSGKVTSPRLARPALMAKSCQPPSRSLRERKTEPERGCWRQRVTRKRCARSWWADNFAAYRLVVHRERELV